jgi:GAF domain-containing protein
MAENLYLPDTTNRLETYEAIYPQIASLIQGEPDLIANLANVTSVLKSAFGFFWIGFYIVKDNQLVLGPFQGTIACTRIDFDKGVCGACYREKKTLIVPDVEQFPGHIACSSASKSEIVVPLFKNGQVIAILDIDSDVLDDFSTDDQIGLEKLMQLVEKCF